MYYSKFNPYIRERVLLYFNSMKVDKEEDKMPVQVSISVLVIAVAVSVMVTLFIGIVLGLLCGIKYMQKKSNSKQCFHTPEENVMSSMKGPVYEEVELEDKTATIDLSQNIAYEQVKKTAS